MQRPVIEFPVFLLQWTLTDDGQLELHTRDVFHSYVRPVWRPRLTQFCRDLTGIRQVGRFSLPTSATADMVISPGRRTLTRHPALPKQSTGCMPFSPRTISSRLGRPAKFSLDGQSQPPAPFSDRAYAG